MTGGTRKHVFISHASQDGVEALAVADFLIARGIPVWISSRDIDPGKVYPPQIEEAIESCGAFIVIVSAAANASNFVKAETEMAFASHPIYPVRIEGVLPARGLKIFLASNQRTDVFGPHREVGLSRLAAALAVELGMAADVPPPPPGPTPHPAPDTAPLSDNDALRAFIGPNAARYLEQWRAMDGRSSKTSFNASAFLLTFLWLGYRKLWLPAVAAAAAFLFAMTLNTYGRKTGETGLTVIGVLLLLGLCAFVGLVANAWYRARAQDAVAAINVAGGDTQTVRDRLEIRGGVSWPAAIGIAIAMLLAVLFVIGAIFSERRHQDPVGNSSDNAADTTSNTAAPATNTTSFTDAAAPYHNFCISNRSDIEINFKLAYGSDPAKAYVSKPGGTNRSYWSVATDTPKIQFVHTLSGQPTAEPRKYDLDTGPATEKDACGGVYYYFTVKNEDIELFIDRAASTAVK